MKYKTLILTSIFMGSILVGCTGYNAEDNTANNMVNTETSSDISTEQATNNDKSKISNNINSAIDGYYMPNYNGYTYGNEPLPDYYYNDYSYNGETVEPYNKNMYIGNSYSSTNGRFTNFMKGAEKIKGNEYSNYYKNRGNKNDYYKNDGYTGVDEIIMN